MKYDWLFYHTGRRVIRRKEEQELCLLRRLINADSRNSWCPRAVAHSYDLERRFKESVQRSTFGNGSGIDP